MNTPRDIAESYVGIGIGKTRMSVSRLFILGVMAGLFIAFAGIASTVAAVSVQTPSVAKLVSAVVFPGGLAMVLIAGSELFTGNCLLILPLLEKKVTVRDVLRNWVFVYMGNFIGGILAAGLFCYSHLPSLFDGGVAQALVNTAAAKVALNFGDALLRGILCNFLVCIAVWMSFAAKTVGGKIMGLYFPIMLFVVSGFEHVVANMYYISAGLFASCIYNVPASGLTWGAFFFRNLLPVTLGNMVGGVAVGAVYWFVYLKKDDRA